MNLSPEVPPHASLDARTVAQPAPLRHTHERECFIDNLLVRNHFIIVMIRWTGLAPWEFQFLFPGSLTSTFLAVTYYMAFLVAGEREMLLAFSDLIPRIRDLQVPLYI